MMKLKINRTLFSDSSIIKTMKAYQNHAKTTVDYNDDYAIVTFWNTKYDENITIKEFENYMIGFEI